MEDEIKDNEALEELKERMAIPTEEKELPVIPQSDIEKTSDVVPEQKISLLTQKILESEVSLALGVINLAQSSVFRFALESKSKRKMTKLFGEDAITRAISLKGDGVSKEDISEKDREILAFQKKVDQVLDGLPLSDDECASLRPLLERYIISNNGNLPKNFFSYLALIQIFGGRVMNVIVM